MEDRTKPPNTDSQSASILLIEDNPADALLVEEALNEHQIKAELLVLGDGEKAIQFVEHFEEVGKPRPKLVILDLNLPKRSGKDVLRCIRDIAHWNHVPVVILSSSNAPDDREETALLGANQYIRKPSQLEEFLSIGAVFKKYLDASC
jgi:two-component system, chemotaxis family, response regulator Rcp1